VRGAWECEVTKVQGGLGKKLPIGKILKAFPHETLLEHYSTLTGKPAQVQDETEIVDRAAAKERPQARAPEPAAGPSGLDAFLDKAKALGYVKEDSTVDSDRIKAVLAAAGLPTGYKPADEARMLQALTEAAAVRTTDPEPVPHPDAGNGAKKGRGK
jgi:hypothetical protein